MLLRIVLTIGCSIAALASFARFGNPLLPPGSQNQQEPNNKNNDRLKKSYSDASPTQKGKKEEKIEEARNIRPSSSLRSFQEPDELLLSELDELLEGDLDFQSQSHREDRRTANNGTNRQNENTMEERYGSDDFALDSEEDEVLEIFETLASQNYRREELTKDYCIPSDKVVEELTQLHSQVFELQEKEMKLESELLEYYGIQEQERNCEELEKLIRQKNDEIVVLNARIGSLESEKKRLLDEIAETKSVKRELEIAKSRVKELEKKIENQSVQSKADLLRLKQLVAALHEKEREDLGKGAETEEKKEALAELEVEVTELRWRNKELELQKRELSVKLLAAEAQIAELASVNESELVSRVEAEASVLRNENEDLSKQVEGLQANRFGEIEELVYLRWVNACLRYELRNYKASLALQLNKTLSPKSQEKAKQLMLQYVNTDSNTPPLSLQPKEQSESEFESISSLPSTPSESGDVDESGQESGPRKPSLLRKLKRWRSRSKESGNGRTSPIISPSLEVSRHRTQSHEALILRKSSDVLAIDTVGTNELTTSDSAIRGADIEGSTRIRPDSVKRLESATSRRGLPKPSERRVERRSASNERQKLALIREESLKESKLPEMSRSESFPLPQKRNLGIVSNKITERSTTLDYHGETSAEGKRSLRIATPPPKPSVVGESSSEAIDSSIKAPECNIVGPPPPPPPPPPSLSSSTSLPIPRLTSKMRKNSVEERIRRAPEVVECYQLLMKREKGKDSGPANHSHVPDAQSNIIEEIENRSSYLLAVKADVETQGDFVRSLAMEVRAANYRNMEDVVQFVTWLDEELSFLVDEHAVLKHFEWPETKTDALREAAFEYQYLKKLENEIRSYEDDPANSCENALKDLLNLLEKVEENIYGLLRNRDMEMARYKEHNIPTYWLSDSELVGKIKLASVQLARKYMRRVASELDYQEGTKEKGPVREFLLLQAVRFAFRVHQFAGGFDVESMVAFEDLQRRAYAFSSKEEEEHT